MRVESERSFAQDVTEEYVDLQCRLKSLQNTEEQYLNLLLRAETVEDTLMVQRELSSVQSQIEQLKGRMNYLEHTSATSLINVEDGPCLKPRGASAARVECPGDSQKRHQEPGRFWPGPCGRGYNARGIHSRCGTSGVSGMVCLQVVGATDTD